MSDCKSNSMANLEAKVRAEAPDNVVVAALAKLTGLGFGNALYGGDLDAAAEILKTVANRIRFLLQTSPESLGESQVQEIFQNVLRSASNLLGRGQRSAWRDLRQGEQMKMATSLLLSLEENAFLLADVVQGEEYLEEASSEIRKFRGEKL